MELVNCPVCQREISPDAEICPGCGHPMMAQMVRPDFWRDPNIGAIGCGIVALILGLILLGWLFP